MKRSLAYSLSLALVMSQGVYAQDGEVILPGDLREVIGRDGKVSVRPDRPALSSRVRMLVTLLPTVFEELRGEAQLHAGCSREIQA